MAVLVAKLQKKGVVLIAGKNSNGSLEHKARLCKERNTDIAPCQFLTIFGLLVGVWFFFFFSLLCRPPRKSEVFQRSYRSDAPERKIRTVPFLLPLGQKFPSKTLEASLNATVHFGEKRQQAAENQPIATGFIEDPFCTGINSYAQVCEHGKVL